jgi:polyphosphate kinase
MLDKKHDPLLTEVDFLHSAGTAATDLGEMPISSPNRFTNRELSWLAFNERVLENSTSARLPLLERVRMLSISSSNLDEFYTVRVAGLREMERNGITRPSIDGRTPSEQLQLIDVKARALLESQQQVWRDLQPELHDKNIHLLSRADLTDEDRDLLYKEFVEQILPVLSPLAIDPAHPFPFIPSGGLALALHLQRDSNKRGLMALVPIPPQVHRFIKLRDEDPSLGQRFILLEDVVLEFLPYLFPDYTLRGNCTFSVLRDSDLEVEEEAEDLVREFETALKRRRRGQVIQLLITAEAPESLRNLVIEQMRASIKSTVWVDGMVGLSDVRSIVTDARSDLQWPVFTPRVPERVQDFQGDIFAAIRQKDMLLHHPYETFDTVVQFLRQAARDPNVLAIKQTLSRTSQRSPSVEALCEAAEQGKTVTALIELKARFDEAANIRQSRRLERAGAHVVYGFLDLKTHAKVSTVVRREGDKLVTYTHFGTGNYHPDTARVYTDVSYFTSSKSLGQAANKLFNYVSGYAPPKGMKRLSMSPVSLKSDLLRMIKEEAEHAREGRPAAIWAKMNSLVEDNVIDALYAASQAGVKIDLVVRGICGLRPGIKGLSENIRVKSIVGRFLEHSRIVCFGNGEGLPSNKARVFISSADWMGRNLSRRVETLVEITNKTVHAQIMHQIMAANMADQANSWMLMPNGDYVRPNLDAEERVFDCHKFFMENPSLSGRGKVGAKDVPKLTHTDADE